MTRQGAVVLAVDIGTTSTKTLAADETGRVLAEHSVAYPMHSPEPGAAEQDPDEICEAVLEGLAAVISRAGLRAEDVLCVSLSAAMHSLIALDREDRPLTRSITWADQRAAAQAERLNADGSGLDVYLRTGTPVHAMSPLVKLMWLREERPGIWNRAARFAGIKEYVLYRLFGEWVMDHSLASATGCFNLEKLAWDEGALRLAGVREEQLPRPVPTTHILSGLDEEAARRTGLSRETPFVVGASDGTLANLGVGALAPGILAVTIGTSGAVRAAADRPATDSQGRLFCYALTERHWIVGGPTNSGALAVRWMADRVCPGRPLEEAVGLAETVPPGADGLLFLPQLAGERAPFWNPLAQGVLFGLTHAHGSAHLIRAAMEGVLFQIRAVMDAVEKMTGRAQEIRASGGFARSPFWCRMLADMTGTPVLVPDTVEGSGMGAVLLGLHALRTPDRPLSAPEPAGGRRWEPNPAAYARYSELMPLYLELYDRLKEPMRAMWAFRRAAASADAGRSGLRGEDG